MYRYNLQTLVPTTRDIPIKNIYKLVFGNDFSRKKPSFFGFYYSHEQSSFRNYDS